MDPVDFPAHAEPAGDVAAATAPLLGWLREAALDRPEALAEYPARLARAAQHLVDGGQDVSEVTRVVAGLNDGLTVALLRGAEARLGEPPCAYTWLVLGSGGRREQALLSDQDSALVYADHRTVPDAAAGYFRALAESTVTGLADAGIPRCPGGYMATTWQHPLADWRRVFRGWVERPEPPALVKAEVFLDFRPVHGSLSPEPLNDILRVASGYRRFLVQMARAAVGFAPPLGLFGRVKTHGREIDLKRGGIAAIVLLARLYGLAAGSLARPTLDRLAAAVEGGTLSRGGGGHLAQHYRFLTELRLRTQLRQIAAGGRPDNRIVLDDLGQGDQRRLRDALRAVHGLQQRTALQFQTYAVS